MKKIILPLVIVFFFTQDIASACATCFGDPNSKATQGMNFAIITMLTITGGVLSSFVSFIYVLNRRAKDYAKKISFKNQENKGN
ncbi:MAG: hypothetical protein CMG17_02335 [Candidatus Marinimicrobia bacterium]|nr:hypothetical protein [Candidatus Neomarinimicrobiota bacterium]|tara:strand:- start:605 stop:856 length:252 start_codon:yes stop_codon:yes gene_type:complete